MRAAGGSALGMLGAGMLASCASSHPSYILASDQEVRAAEAARAFSGTTVHRRLTAEQELITLEPGKHMNTWGFRGEEALAALGPTITASKNDRLLVEVDNRLTQETSVHWHGLRIRNDMDGAPPDTQAAIEPSESFTYDFLLPDHGTYWYHSHTGVQADRSMFGALVVENPQDESGADVDHVLVLDDWLLERTTPEEVLAALGAVTEGGHDHGAPVDDGSFATPAARELVEQGMGHSAMLGGPSQHLAYPTHLINGRPVSDPDRLEASPGAAVRLRVINASAETPYRIALAGHRVKVIATDGFDAEPFETDAVLIAPAQRVDLLVRLRSGAWPFVARVEGREGAGLAVLATSDAVGETPRGHEATRLAELDRTVATDSDLRPAPESVLDERDPDLVWRLDLIELPDTYVWGIAGDDATSMRPREGDRVRIELTNETSMWHPMHLHGHTFASRTHNGLRRDTEIVLPGETAVLDFEATNPGRWMIHCHNAYHFVAGMTAPIRYVR